MNWLFFAFLSVFCFWSYNVFTKISSDKFSPTIAMMFMAWTSFLVALVSTLFLKFSGQNFTFSKNEIIFPILAWLSTWIAEIFYLIMFSKNTPVSIWWPFVLAWTIILTTILWILILNEGFNLIKILWVFIIVIWIIIISKG